MEESISLLNFSPLIQLLAGVYLLLMYENRFHISPVKNYNENYLKPKLTEFLLNFQCEKASLNECIEKNATKEQNFIDYLRRIYWLSLLYCVFLLLYSGVEPYFKGQNYFYGLISVILFYSLDAFLLLFFRKRMSFIKKYICIFLSFLGVMLI